MYTCYERDTMYYFFYYSVQVSDLQRKIMWEDSPWEVKKKKLRCLKQACCIKKKIHV